MFKVLFFVVILTVLIMELCVEIGTPLECGDTRIIRTVSTAWIILEHR
jgi:hypothetical protein